MPKSPQRGVYICKTTRMGPNEATFRPECNEYNGWMNMRMHCGKRRNEPNNDAPRRVPSKGMRRWKAERPTRS